MNIKVKRLTAGERAEVWAKSDGYCWYCGAGLPDRGWHADHVNPVLRYPNGPWRPENHTLDNIVPACAPCNLFKASFTVEGFRHELEQSVSRARRASIGFRNAERFELISIASDRVVFWFERTQCKPGEMIK